MVQQQVDTSEKRRFRTIFISDVHLGTKACQAELLLDFLRKHDAERIFLVGDIVDFWRLERSVYWPQAHNDVIQKLLRKARKGAKVVLLPGNHDERLRDYCGSKFGGVDVVDTIIHETADGRRVLVLHGDQFDVVVCYAKWLSYVGNFGYDAAIWVNVRLNYVRRRLGLGYWSLSAFLKQKVKHAVSYIGDFEQALAQEAERQGADGVICGHIHHATRRMIGKVEYMNCGDWVESGTALVEHHDGSFEIIRWLDAVEAQRQPSPMRRRQRAAA